MRKLFSTESQCGRDFALQERFFNIFGVDEECRRVAAVELHGFFAAEFLEDKGAFFVVQAVAVGGVEEWGGYHDV